MKRALLLLCLAAPSTAAAAEPDGKILEQAPFPLPAYADLPPFGHTLFPTAEAYAAMRDPADVELVRIRYVSGGLEINGFLYRPRHPAAGKRLPVLIWNHGGVGEESRIAPENIQSLYEMWRYARAGYVVVASQYRGVAGSQGTDEIAGADLHDVESLFPLVRALPYADPTRIHMWGFSRGALMTLMALRGGADLRSVIVVGAPTDFAAQTKDNGPLMALLRRANPKFDTVKETERRSPILWADKLGAPLLIFHGGDDDAVPARDIEAFAHRLDELHKPYELHVWLGDDHYTTRHLEDRIARTLAWLADPPRPSIAREIRRTLDASGVDAAIRRYRDLARTQSDRWDFGERELNRLGYVLLAAGKVKDAVAILELNTQIYPKAFNTWDSLGEAYLAAGERDKAIAAYRRSLELNPASTSGRDALTKLGQ